jgi:hypothetical protein
MPELARGALDTQGVCNETQVIYLKILALEEAARAARVSNAHAG